MRFQLPYGRSFLTLEIPEHRSVDVIAPPNAPALEDPHSAVSKALQNMLGGIGWRDFFGKKSVAIAVNDKTRPVPHDLLLPPLLDVIASLGIPKSAVTFYIAVGAHPPMSADEFISVLPGEIISQYRVICHDAQDKSAMHFLGKTTRGTPVWARRDFTSADIKIVVGSIAPHQFMGFSGGVKTAAIGLSGKETINANHALMSHPDSRLGVFEQNPARQDVEEIGKMMGIHLALNVILNSRGELVHVLAGKPSAVMRFGVPLARQVCQVAVSRHYHLVIASPGGHPKDINVYQAQKALAHASLITQPGGSLILAAACPEGAGSPQYERWMKGKASYADVINAFKAEPFQLGPHKAFQIARDAIKLNLYTYSSMDEVTAKRLLLNPIEDIQDIINSTLKTLPDDACVAIMPHASSTIPR